MFTKTYTKIRRLLFLVFSQIGFKRINEAVVNIFTFTPGTKIYTSFNDDHNNCKHSEYIYVILVTKIKGIQGFFLHLTFYFQHYGFFKFYENVNFRVNNLIKNPHCTKCISHRTI